MNSLSSPAGSRSRPLRRGLLCGAAALVLLGLAACGASSTSSSTSTGSSGGTPTPAASTPTPSTAAALSCPSASTAGAALGLTLPAPTSTALGLSGVECNYLSGASDVLIILVNDVPAAYLSTAEASFAATQSSVNFTPVSGIGDEAYSYSYALGATTAEGILAVKGTSFVGLYCTATTATMAQVQALVRQLLG